MEGLLLIDAPALAALLPDVPGSDSLSGRIPDAELLGEREKSLAYAPDLFRSPRRRSDL